MAASLGQQLTVLAGVKRVTLAASGVAEVIRAPNLTRAPHGPSVLLGVTHHRGRRLPVVSLSGLLGDGNGASQRVVVLRCEPPVGLAVQAVEALETIQADKIPEEGRLRLQDSGDRTVDLEAMLALQFAAPDMARRDRSTAVEAPNDPRSGEAMPARAFLRFGLAGQAYAFPLDAVAEVASAPAEIAVSQRADELLIGFVQRGEAAMPLLSARALLGLPQSAAAQRLIVARVGDRELGLLVDSVQSVLRLTEDRVAPAPSLFNRGEGEARIEAVLRMPDGKRVVSVLSPDRLLAHARVARLLHDERLQEAMASVAVAFEKRGQRVLVVQLGDERHGLPLTSIEAVVRRPDRLTRLPKAPPYVQGVANLRGRATPIIDLRERFAISGVRTAATRIIVVTVAGLRAGLAVDRVAGVLDTSEAPPATPARASGGGPTFDRAVERGGEVIPLIDPEVLVREAGAELVRDFKAIAS